MTIVTVANVQEVADSLAAEQAAPSPWPRFFKLTMPSPGAPFVGYRVDSPVRVQAIRLGGTCVPLPEWTLAKVLGMGPFVREVRAL